MDQTEKDYIAYRAYVDLWAAENPIKTNKLQVLLIVNALLVSALHVGGGFHTAKWPIFMAGSVFSVIWLLSIGRTSLFQKVWRTKAIELSNTYTGDHRFQLLDTEAAELAAPRWLRLLGAVPSRFYLLGTPVVFALAWTGGLVYIILKRAGCQ
ncbi:MAG: hypothetical protein WB930_07130 [Syntrophobacteraceae bacterium]